MTGHELNARIQCAPKAPFYESDYRVLISKFWARNLSLLLRFRSNGGVAVTTDVFSRVIDSATQNQSQQQQYLREYSTNGLMPIDISNGIFAHPTTNLYWLISNTNEKRTSCAGDLMIFYVKCWTYYCWRANWRIGALIVKAAGNWFAHSIIFVLHPHVNIIVTFRWFFSLEKLEN